MRMIILSIGMIILIILVTTVKDFIEVGGKSFENAPPHGTYGTPHGTYGTPHVEKGLHFETFATLRGPWNPLQPEDYLTIFEKQCIS